MTTENTMTITCTCVEDGRCQLCHRTVPHVELIATPYAPRDGERELYWCIDCGGDGAVLLHCRDCDTAGSRWAHPQAAA